jgi:hypothetical protein
MTIKEAQFIIKDIQYKEGIYLISIAITAGEYKFSKAFKLQPINGKVDMTYFREIVRNAIIDEVKIREAIKPIESIKEEIQKIDL